MPIILQIAVECNTGSTGTIAEKIGEITIDNGWESHIAYGRFHNSSTSISYKIETPLGVIIHGLKTRLFDQHGLGSMHATRKLISYIKEIKPDIIHLHHLHGYYINFELLFKFLSEYNVPVVWTFHDCWAFTGHCAHYTFAKCEKWKKECNNCPLTKEYPSSILIDRSKQNFYLKKKLFNSVDNLTIVSVSNWLNSQVSESFLNKQRHIVIYNGINTDIFKPSDGNYLVKKHGLENKIIFLGIASPWSNRKGYSDFIELSKKLKRNEVIVLIGLNNKQLRQLPSNIIGFKRTENIEELVNWYSIADVFINLSVEETFGLTTAEALSCGTPSIVYNSTACPEIVDDKTGIIVDVKDIKGIRMAMDKIISHHKERYINNCRKRVINLFDASKNYKKYLSLYDNLLNKIY